MGLVGFDLPTGALAVRTASEDARLVDTDPMVSVTLRFQFARAGDVLQHLHGLFSQRGRVVVDTVTNSLVLSDAVSRMPRLRALAASLDRQ
jgi:type II secretory pathway component HofQ